jgi:hypothetical protein
MMYVSRTRRLLRRLRRVTAINFGHDLFGPSDCIADRRNRSRNPLSGFIL